MTRFFIAVLLLASTLVGAHAFGMGRFSSGFSKLGSLGQRGVAPVSPTGFLLINAGSVMLISTAPSKFKIQ